jgi:hypothetical protein
MPLHIPIRSCLEPLRPLRMPRRLLTSPSLSPATGRVVSVEIGHWTLPFEAKAFNQL